MLDLAPALERAHQTVGDAYRQHGIWPTVSLFSGGNDSTVSTHLTRRYLDAAAHINTGTGIPATTQFVRDTCKTWDLDLAELVTPPEVYEQFLFDPESLRVNPGKPLRRGFPGPSGHQAVYYYLKQRRIRELRARYVQRRGDRVVFITGIRAAESSRRMGRAMSAPVRREGSIVWVSPILHFTSEMMNAYRAEYHVPRNPVADILHRSGECLCGAFAKSEELAEIELWFPEVGARIRGLERRLEAAGVAACKWGGQDRHGTTEAGPLCSSCTTP